MKALFVVYSRPVSKEREDEFNEWYDEVHIPEIVAVPGFTSGRRYELTEVVEPGSAADVLPAYLAIYEIDSDDPSATVAEAKRRWTTGLMTPSTAVGREPSFRALYRPR